MKTQKTKFPLRRKSVLIIAIMAIVLGTVAVVVSAYSFSRNNENKFKKEATELAATVSTVVDPATVAELRNAVDTIYDSIEDKVGSEYMGTARYNEYIAKFSHIEETPAFQSLHAQLREIQDVNDVGCIYILYVDVPTKSTVYLVDAAVEDPCPPGNFDPVYEQNIAVLSRPQVGFPAYITNTPEYGWLVSAAVPIYGEDKQVCAFAFVDVSMNAVKEEERNFILFLSGLLAVITIVISALGIMAVNRAVVKPINRLSRAANQYYNGGEKGKKSFAGLDIHTGDEIENLAMAMTKMEDDMNVYIDNLTSVTAEKERIGAELNVATKIQADMLPRIFPAFPDRKDFDIYATMAPAKEVGGDFYDFFLIDDDHIALVMADVSGKGVPAALFMVVAKTLIKNRAQMGDSPAEILKHVNEQLCDGNEAEMFVTVWLAIIELSTGKGKAANAGHEHPVLRRNGGKYEMIVYRHSPAVAVFETTRFREHEFEIRPGDTLFVYTDGVTEATNAREELFGTERMLNALNGHPEANPEDMLKIMKNEIDRFVGSAPQFDDITMLAMQYNGPEQLADEEITVEAKIENLETVLGVLGARLEKTNCPMRVKMQIELAVEEAFVNVANYAYGDKVGEARIRFANDNGITITLMDQGTPYDPLKREDPDVSLPAEVRPIGGLGVYMVKKTMDEVGYEYADGWNVLKMRKSY